MPALESASPASCKTPATSIDSIHPNNCPRSKKKKEKKKDQLSANHIILPSPATQNTGLKEVDLEPKPKGSSDKINKLRPKSQNTTENSCIIQPGLTFEKTPLREVDLQPRAQRGTERIEALMSL